MELYIQAQIIIDESIKAVLPDEAVNRALKQLKPCKRNYVLAIGKAAWQMSKKTEEILGENITEGICITKYGHIKAPLKHIRCFEAGHPFPDKNGTEATKKALEMIKGMDEDDQLIFLISGGGSALFEDPKISLEELQDITGQMLKKGLSIKEINVIRKRLSNVKGGRTALLCKSHVFTVILSDIINDPLDMIASGPACIDPSTYEDVLNILKKYHLELNEKTLELLKEETPKEINNVENHVAGNLKELCKAAKASCEKLGYETTVLSESLECFAKDAGNWLGDIAVRHAHEHKRAFICGGETVVEVKGNGLGGRNQELALSAVKKLDGLGNVALFSIGSDGTDGPTDAAGGYVDSSSYTKLKNLGIDYEKFLENNDSYHALKAIDSLIITGPTGTNVNDLTVLLIDN